MSEQQNYTPAAPPPDEGMSYSQEPLASFSPDVSADTGVQSCSYAGAAPPQPAPKPKPCDVQSLVLNVYNAGEGDYESFNAPKRLRDGPPPGAAPPHLRDELRRYDLVIELLTTESSKAGGTVTGGNTGGRTTRAGRNRASGTGKVSADTDAGDGPSTLDGKANYKAKCGERAHDLLVLTWRDEDGAAREKKVAGGAQLHEAVYAYPLMDGWLTDPIEVWRKLWDHSRMVSRYELKADSCGRPASGPATDELSALVLAHPVDKWGVVMEFNLPTLSFGWSPERASQRQAQKSADLKLKAEQIQFPRKQGRIKKYKAARAAAEKKRQKVLDEKQAFENPGTVTGIIQDARYGMGRTGEEPFDFAIVLNDREFSSDSIERAREGIESVKNFIKRAKAASDTFTEIITTLKNCSPGPVQPQVALEVGLLNGEVELTSRYRLHSKGDRFLAVQRQFLLEVEVKLIALTGTIALVVGKRVAGTGADLTGSLTVEASVYVETKVHFAQVVHDPDSWHAGLWKQLKEFTKFKTQFDVVGRVEVRATAAYYEVLRAGASVRGRAKFEDWQIQGSLAATVVADPVVAELYAGSDIGGASEVKAWVIMEASSTRRTFWTY